MWCNIDQTVKTSQLEHQIMSLQLLPIHTMRLGVELDSFDGHHYISTVAPEGPVAKHGLLRPEDELLEVNTFKRALTRLSSRHPLYLALWVGGLPGFGQPGVLLLAGGGAPLLSCLNKTDLCSLPAPGLREGLVWLMRSRGCSGRRAPESDRGHLRDCPLPYPPPLALLPAPFLLPFPLPPGVVAEGRCALRLLLLAAARMVQGRFAGLRGNRVIARCVVPQGSVLGPCMLL